jgi:hypothetical protein
MEFRLRTLPKKYLKRRKLLRPRIIQRKRNGCIAEKAVGDRTGVATDSVARSKDLSLTINGSPAPSVLQPSNGKNVSARSPFLDSSPTVTSRQQSSLFLDTGFREQNISFTVSHPNTQERRASLGLDAPITQGQNVANFNNRSKIEDVEQVHIGQATSHSPKSRIYAIKQKLKILRRKTEKIFSKLGKQAGMVNENFRSYMQRVYYRYFLFNRNVWDDFPTLQCDNNNHFSVRLQRLFLFSSADDTTCLCLPKSSPIRVFLCAFVYNRQFESLIIGAIIIGTILLVAPDPPPGPLLKAAKSMETAVSVSTSGNWKLTLLVVEFNKT